VPVISCPVCIAHIGLPPGVPPGEPVECPNCHGRFPMPQPPKANPVVKPTKVVGGRSDYLDTSDFTAGGGRKEKERVERPISGVVTVIVVLGSTLIATAMAGTLIFGKNLRKGEKELFVARNPQPPAAAADPPPVVEEPPPPPPQADLPPAPPAAEPGDAGDWDRLTGDWEYTANTRGAEGEAVPVRMVFRKDRTATIEWARFKGDEFLPRPELTVTGPATVGRTDRGDFVVSVQPAGKPAAAVTLSPGDRPKSFLVRYPAADGTAAEFYYEPK
jgi:hypothetical protein